MKYFALFVLVSFVALASAKPKNVKQINKSKLRARANRPPVPENGSCEPVNSSNQTEVWLFHNETNRCVKENEKGPCGEMMIIKKDPNNRRAGVCECNDRFYPAELNGVPEYCGRRRPKIYWPAKGRCYSYFNQGPCRKGDWLVLDQNTNPMCQINPCPHADSDDAENAIYWFIHNGRCHRTYTYGYCGYKRFLLPTEHSWKPVCSAVQNRDYGFIDETAVKAKKVAPVKEKEKDDSEQDDSEEEDDEEDEEDDVIEQERMLRLIAPKSDNEKLIDFKCPEDLGKHFINVIKLDSFESEEDSSQQVDKVRIPSSSAHKYKTKGMTATRTRTEEIVNVEKVKPTAAPKPKRVKPTRSTTIATTTTTTEKTRKTKPPKQSKRSSPKPLKIQTKKPVILYDDDDEADSI